MRRARIHVHGIPVAELQELENGRAYRVAYDEDYSGPPISLTMPVGNGPFTYEGFPPFFDGVLPEGAMLEGLLMRLKVDDQDYFSQLMAVGVDLVGAVTVLPLESNVE